MKAQPVINVPGVGYQPAPADQATHVALNFPGPVGLLHLPVVRHGKREGTGCWTWNGSVDAPTLRPSVLTQGVHKMTAEEHKILMAGGKIEQRPYRCHTWVTHGQAYFLDDCSHALQGQVVDMLELEA